jgi:catechol 2,3-dioxygenase-like lactoylglutathione lyase family enzyme
MKRLHINLQVNDIAAAKTKYQALLGVEPTFVKTDYMKWELDDPALNLSITDRGLDTGLDHLGIKYDDAAEFEAASERLSALGEDLREQKNSTCCYAHSDKGWWKDPVGLSWELFVTHGQTETFSGSAAVQEDSAEGEPRRNACC